MGLKDISTRVGRRSVRWAKSKVDDQMRIKAKRDGLKELQQNNLRSDLLLLPASGERMVFRVSDTLNMAQLKNESFEKFGRYLLGDLRLNAWSVGQEYGNFRSWNVRDVERESLLRFLKGRPELAHWYYQEIRPQSKPGKPGLLKSINPNRKFSGLRIFERVAYDANSNFRAGAREGVLIHFWNDDLVFPEHLDETNSSGLEVIKSEIWNPYVTVLPHPKMGLDNFSSAIRSANLPLNTDIDFEIDAVYTWVNGSDSEWQAIKAGALQVGDSESFVHQAVSDARFADHDELRYSLRSIDQFAPWIRKIWIVTAGQTPEWLDTSNPSVEIVDHKDIWPSSAGLPNFNSHAIESNLHRIPGLARHFLYFNDDCVLTRPLSPSVFYHGNGISKVFFSKAMVDFEDISEVDNASAIAAKNARMYLSKAGYKGLSRKFFHTPSALNKEVLSAAEREFPEAFAITSAAQFRQPTDVAAAGSFYFNYALSIGKAVPGSIKYDYIDPAVADGRDRMARVLKSRDKDCIVINDGSSPEEDAQRSSTDQFIRRSLAELLPVRSAFER
ncbi:Stealth CR1 domain-containing protein [Glutamicibacter ardleyensis]|uniref:Stealth CR1 domain-containing protein n=1 Tax=Glutamicibacter ardleyensis TaxID=225894 RepID=UPI003FD24AB2